MNNNPTSTESATGNRLALQRTISVGMLSLTLAIVGIYLLRPLFDPDFYWHLKTGQWIWQNKSLPHMDLFGIPPLPASSARTEFIYTSYWLIQLVLYAFYSLSGLSGIILFRWVIAGISFLICTSWTNVRESNVSAVIAIGSIQLLEFYFLERPQFVSFICFGVLLVILFRFFDQRASGSLWSTLVTLSLLMLFWSNMHGGFLIGQTILIYCVIAEGVKFFHCSLMPLSVRNYRILLISSMTALIASFINPNPINLIKYLPGIFDADHYLNQNNLEEQSLLEYFRLVQDYTIFLYIASIVLTFRALLVSTRRKNITWVGILAGTAVMGCQHIRLMPFFLVAAMIFMTKFFEVEYSSIKGRVVLMLMLAVNTAYCVSDEFPRIRETLKSGWVPSYQFPVQAADFMTHNDISGNIYTTMYWGGYMIWRVGPESKIFYDSRTLSTQRALEYDNSLIIATNQRPYWKGLFDVYDVHIVVLPIYEDDGSPNLLTQSIHSDKEWSTVFASEHEAVFLRNELKIQRDT